MGLRRSVRRLEEADPSLDLSQGQHAVFKEGCRELFGSDTVDLVATVGDEVEHESGLAEFLRKLAHLVVSHARRVPVERRREVVGKHLVGELGMDCLGELLRLVDIG